MRILIFGDSIVHGRCDDECFGWANRLAAYCQRQSLENDWETSDLVFNLGIAGDTIGKLGFRFDVEFDRRTRSSERGDVLTIFSFGLNDCAIEPETGASAVHIDDFTAGYMQFVKTAMAKGEVIVLGLTPIDETRLNAPDWLQGRTYREAQRTRYDAAIADLAQESGVHHTSLSDVFDPTKMTTDGLHPSAAGHQRIFERVRDELRDLTILT